MSISARLANALNVALADPGAGKEAADILNGNIPHGVTISTGDLTLTAGNLTLTAGDLTLTDGDIVLTATGTKIGTATSQKLAFFNAAPVVQPVGAAQGALTNSTGGTADGTLSAVGDTMAGDQSAVLNNNFTELFTLQNAIRTALVNLGLIKGSA